MMMVARCGGVVAFSGSQKSLTSVEIVVRRRHRHRAIEEAFRRFFRFWLSIRVRNSFELAAHDFFAVLGRRAFSVFCVVLCVVPIQL